MGNKEKFLSLVSGEDSSTLVRNEWLIKNRSWLRKSQEIAMLILDSLEAKGWTQKKLASEMNVSPQLVNKWLKGSENLTLDTISRLEDVLEIRILNVASQKNYTVQDDEKLEVTHAPKIPKAKKLDSSIEVGYKKQMPSIAAKGKQMITHKVKA